MKKLCDIENPYDWSRPIINVEEFAGRKEEIDIINDIYEQVKIGKCINLAIYGERATGKSSLLNLIKSKLNEKGGLAIKINLDENIVKNEIDFIANMFDAIIEEGVGRGLLGGKILNLM